MRRGARRTVGASVFALTLGMWTYSSGAGLFDTIKGLLGPGSPNSSELSSGDISQGLLEALRVGAEKAVSRASTAGGFLQNPKIHIPLPPPIEKAGGLLRTVGLGATVDEFETTLNRGAERAAGSALPILGRAIEELTFQDVERIWKGGDSAATDYFRTKTKDALLEAFLPVVHSAVQEVGVTRAYESLTASPLAQLTPGNVDLDRYVANKGLEGLFVLLAEEEKQIRTDPAARTTDLLRKVFGQP